MENKIDFVINYLEHLKSSGTKVIAMETTRETRESNPSDENYNPMYTSLVPTGVIFISITAQIKS